MHPSPDKKKSIVTSLQYLIHTEFFKVFPKIIFVEEIKLLLKK